MYLHKELSYISPVPKLWKAEVYNQTQRHGILYAGSWRKKDIFKMADVSYQPLHIDCELDSNQLHDRGLHKAPSSMTGLWV